MAGVRIGVAAMVYQSTQKDISMSSSTLFSYFHDTHGARHLRPKNTVTTGHGHYFNTTEHHHAIKEAC